MSINRVLILHGWGGSDAPHWQAELAAEVARNYGVVSFPLLDNCHFPSKNRWLKQLKEMLATFQPNIVVCHSLANTLWFWLCQDEIDTVDKLFLVAPPSMQTDIETIKTFFPCPNPPSLYAKEVEMIVSDNDPYMELDEAKELASLYKIPLTVLENSGHINVESGFGQWKLIEEKVLGE